MITGASLYAHGWCSRCYSGVHSREASRTMTQSPLQLQREDMLRMMRDAVCFRDLLIPLFIRFYTTLSEASGS
jgi:hypothetical protein